MKFHSSSPLPSRITHQPNISVPEGREPPDMNSRSVRGSQASLAASLSKPARGPTPHTIAPTASMRRISTCSSLVSRTHDSPYAPRPCAPRLEPPLRPRLPGQPRRIHAAAGTRTDAPHACTDRVDAEDLDVVGLRRQHERVPIGSDDDVPDREIEIVRDVEQR